MTYGWRYVLHTRATSTTTWIRIWWISLTSRTIARSWSRSHAVTSTCCPRCPTTPLATSWKIQREMIYGDLFQYTSATSSCAWIEVCRISLTCRSSTWSWSWSKAITSTCCVGRPTSPLGICWSWNDFVHYFIQIAFSFTWATSSTTRVSIGCITLTSRSITRSWSRSHTVTATCAPWWPTSPLTSGTTGTTSTTASV